MKQTAKASDADEAPKARKRGLTAAFVEKARQPGKYGDGNGLYLIVDPSGASRWILRVQNNGRRRDVGLGGTRSVSLAEARDLAHEVRRKAKSGHDPVAVRRAERDGVPTFEQCATTIHEAHLKTWRNGKHTKQWLQTIKIYANPVIGKRAVNRIETADILKILLPIWTTKPETARRVLQRLRIIFDHATAAGHRSGENPCRLAVIGLPKQSNSAKHFAAMPYADVPAFLKKLRAWNSDEIVKLALEFAILTAGRTNEILEAPKVEFDTKKALWVIPRERMKADREHTIPLCGRVIEIVERVSKIHRDDALLFPSPSKKGQPLSDMAMLMLLRRMKVPYTVHGFRSSFRDWCSEETEFPGEVAEMALAHAVSNKTEAAYRRGKLLEKRRSLMEQWAKFVLGSVR